jgi:hypothetical protein
MLMHLGELWLDEEIVVLTKGDLLELKSFFTSILLTLIEIGSSNGFGSSFINL